MSNNFKRIQQSTLTALIDLWLQNFSRNLSHILEEDSIREISNFKKTVNSKIQHEPTSPVIVIGAGPSVKEHRHLEKLAASEYEGAIVCTDRMLIPALKNGITPDKFPDFYVLTIDAVEEQAKFYDDPLVKKYSDKIYVGLSSCTSPKVVNICEKNNLKTYWFNPLMDDFRKIGSFGQMMNIMTKSNKNPKGLPAIQTGGNVGTSCWVFSWAILGKSPTVLLGLNFGYLADTPIEKTQHYQDVLEDYVDNPELVKNDFKVLHNSDIDCKVLIDPVFDFYREGFRDLVIRTPKWVKTINATEGGSLFGERIESMKFLDFLNNKNRLS